MGRERGVVPQVLMGHARQRWESDQAGTLGMWAGRVQEGRNQGARSGSGGRQGVEKLNDGYRWDATEQATPPTDHGGT